MCVAPTADFDCLDGTDGLARSVLFCRKTKEGGKIQSNQRIKIGIKIGVSNYRDSPIRDFSCTAAFSDRRSTERRGLSYSKKYTVKLGPTSPNTLIHLSQALV